MIDYSLIFVTGLLTSLHCIGMCGVIVLAYSVPIAKSTGWLQVSGFTSHVAYNVGRVLSYALLGAIVGLIGVTLSGFERVAEVVSIVSGVIMIVAGVAMLGILPIPTTLSFGGNSFGVGKLHGRLIREQSFPSRFSLGFLTPLLPCGILYAMLAKAAASGSAVNGAMTMGVFGIGMAPSLMLLGSFTSFFSAKVRKRAEMIAAVTIVLMGATLVLRGLHVPFVSFIPMGGPAAGEHHSCCE
ncbi:MAG: sulfite exporter TauE/SafE family protein [Ignavibacteriae bacterium]|nr:sulfite exporter TauE/SafE family protein [Ignavibacteriota bacterium]